MNTIRIRNIVFVVTVAVLVIYFLNSASFFSNDEKAITCAKTIISEDLKAPSTAIWSNASVLDKDRYGRYLVDITCEAQNSFGGYVKERYLVVVSDMKSDGTFRYNKLFSKTTYSEYTKSEAIEYLKQSNNWDQK